MSESMPRIVPTLAASAAVFRDGRLLLAARGKEPMRGVFTLPGGHVEAGETLAEAARREVREETGLDVRILGFVDHNEVILRGEDGEVTRHFVICAFAAQWQGGEASLSEEALECRWVDPATLDGLPVTAGLHAIVARALTVWERSRGN